MPRLVSFAIGSIATVAAVCSAWAFWPYTMDDSYITLRYAENAVRHGALVYNAEGPRAEGYTSLSWTLLMMLPHLLGLAAVPFAKIAGILSLAAAAALATSLARRIGERGDATRISLLPWAVPVWMLAFAPSSLHAVSGMETALFTLLLTGFLSELHRNASAPESAGRGLIFWGLALGLTRPEGNAVAALGYALLFAWSPPVERKRLVLRVLGIHGLVSSGYFVLRAAYYGALWPLPFYVKVTNVTGWPGVEWVKSFLSTALLPLIPSLVLGVWVAVRAQLRNRGAWAVALCLIFTWALFLRASHLMGIEHRFLYPTFPALCALAAGGLQLFWQGAALKPRLRLAVVIGCALAPALLFAQSFKLSHESARGYALGLAQAHQTLALQLASAVVAGKSSTQCRLAIGDAGIVPYLSKWTTLDTFGLNDFHIATAQDHSGEYVAAFQPDVWVLLSSSAERFVPLLEWEEEALSVAQARGYDFSRRIKFNEQYYLWVGQPGVNAASACRLP